MNISQIKSNFVKAKHKRASKMIEIGSPEFGQTWNRLRPEEYGIEVTPVCPVSGRSVLLYQETSTIGYKYNFNDMSLLCATAIRI